MIQTIGKYRVLERIGRGAMGTVLKAHDPVLDRVVALKLISSHLEVTDELRARFFREAQTCARLTHPNIVTVHDLAEIDGQLVIVMEFLDGEELRELIAQQRPMPIEEKIGVMVQVCDGLAYAHREGIVHRDIKPANILVLRNGGVKILDFGIARIMNAEPGLTRTGFIVGTLRYMAPEQGRGQADHRADIFSVGTVFYEFLAHRPAFPGESPMEILEALRTFEPPRLNELDSTIPVELAETIAVAMRKDPVARLTDLAVMRERLLATQGGLATEARRLRETLRERVAQVRRLEEMVSEQLGQPLELETLPVTSDTARVADLMAHDRAIGRRIELLQAALERAIALEPAVKRGLDRLQAGRFEEAIADLESVVSALPEHGRAGAALRQAREEQELERRRREQLARLAEAHRAYARGAFAECLASLEVLNEANLIPEVAVSVDALRLAVEAAGARERAVEARRRCGEPTEAVDSAWRAAEETSARASEGLRDGRHSAAIEAFRTALDLYRRAELEAGGPALDVVGGIGDAALAPPSGDDSTVVHPPNLTTASPAGVRTATTLPAADQTALRPRHRDPARRKGATLVAAFGALGVVAAGAYLIWPVAPRQATVSSPSSAPGRAQSIDPLATERAAIEELRRRVADARKESEQTQASVRAPSVFGSAVERERQADVAVASQRYAEARTHYAAALTEYEAATAQARRAAAASLPDAGTGRRQSRVQDARLQAAEEARAASLAARAAAERAGAGPVAGQTFQAAGRLEQEGQAALARRDYDTARRRFRESAGQYRAALGEARTIAEADERRQRAEAEQFRQRSSTSSHDAEQAGGDRYAGSQMTAARSKVRDALAALDRQDYARAAALFREADSDFKGAAQDAQRQAAAERQAVAARERQAAEIEKLRRDVIALRDQAIKSEAGTLARDMFEAAQTKEREGEGLFSARDYSAARQTYQEAVGHYDGAVKRALALGEARARANQERARMEAEKQRAQRTSPHFSDAQRQEQEGTAMYQGLGFNEAGERFRTAAALYARAIPPSPSIQRPKESLGSFGVDASPELHKVISDLRRAYESKDVALLQQIRPGLGSEELRRIRETFDNLRSYQLDLQIETIEFRGSEAQARAFRKDVTVAKDGQIHRTESRVTVRFKRQQNRWTIDDIK